MTLLAGLMLGIGLGLLAGAGVALFGRLPTTVRLELEQDERVLFEAQQDGLLVVDAFGRVVRANRAALALVGRESLQDELLIELLPDYDVEGDAQMRKTGAGTLLGMVRPQELETSRGPVPIELHAAPLAGGNTLFVLREPVGPAPEDAKLAHDLREARRELAQKERVLANLTHELQTPMRAVLGHLGPLAGSVAEQPELAEQVARLQRVAGHLGQVIDGVLDLAALGARPVQLRRETVSVPTLVRRVEEAVRPLAEGAGHTLIVHNRFEDTIEADPLRLEQILLNLLDNAVKFTDAGTITLSVERGADGVLAFEVRDTGSGIAEDQQELVFGEFTQTHDLRDREVPDGAGLGLSISRKLARLMGGEIVLSSSLGEGSTFTLRLPTGLFSEVR